MSHRQLALLLTLLVAPAVRAGDAARGREVMVATAHPAATEAALELLARGGNAVDAACAAQLALAVVEPQSSGLGGGGFLLYRPAGTTDVLTLDGREMAPASASADLFLDEQGEPVPFRPQRITGGRPVGVPGTPALMARALEKHGSRPLEEILGPAVRLARVGFPVSRALHLDLLEHAERLSRDPASRRIFLDPEGRPWPEGHRMRRPDLARTFEHLAREGLGACYRGPIAEAIVHTVRGTAINPGGMTLEDLAAYRVLERAPVCSTYRGHEVVGMGPPSSGGTTVAEILNLLEPTDLHVMAPGDVTLLHRLAAAMRLAFADRNRYVGDPDHVQVPVADLISKEFAAARATQLGGPRLPPGPALPGSPGETAPPHVPTPTEEEDGGETSHIVVVDDAGNVVCWTTTIEAAFGAALTVAEWGILLNNELTDFDPVPTFADGTPRPNAAGPRKRPRSSMAPTLIFKDGKLLAALGSPGGSRIIGIVVNIIVGMVDLELNVQQAIDMARVVHRNRPDGGTELEQPLLADPHLLRALRARGHQLVQAPEEEAVTPLHPFRVCFVTTGPALADEVLWGAAQGVQWCPDGTLLGGSDPRRGGRAAGW